MRTSRATLLFTATASVTIFMFGCPATPGSPCNSDLDCNDRDPCTTNSCNDNACVIEVIMCEWGLTCQSGECLPDEHCTSQCEPDLPCTTRTFDAFENFVATRDAWETEIASWPPIDFEDDGQQEFPFMYVGSCPATSVTFLFRSGGFTSNTHFFDTATGVFLSLRGSSDALDPVCNGVNYWPEYRECPDAVITEVIAGSFYQVGQMIEIW